MARAVVVAVLLMQCCNAVLAARPLLDAAAGDGGAWLGLQGGGAGTLVLCSGPGGGNNSGWQDPKHPRGGC
ncbi:hypothetical protein BAE44_0021037 [Dichanthelium oligosanthes]|uniref:Expansin-like EG45 domain-containing protein n=1 Tax=Dichanthelium oligosanthes TaxID=888268 RepID=A0A1E5UYT3_9POAL|nr:hypothetical protein BAE44_0021037 [Dichanthelium oligosanthes]